MREAWQTYELEMINYQNKCRIIRGWDDLFTKCKEHLNSVAAMKLSPYYRVLAAIITVTSYIIHEVGESCMILQTVIMNYA